MGCETDITCTINGESRTFHVHPMVRLIDLLREHAQLTGTKEGCGEGECGACAVLIDGELSNSCLVPALQVDGREITTIEGIASDDRYRPLLEAFVTSGGTQCGMCTPGMVLASVSLLKKLPHPTPEEIRTGLAGNFCRCTGYSKIIESVTAAQKKMNQTP